MLLHNVNPPTRDETIIEVNKIVTGRRADEERKTVDIEELRFLEIYRKLSNFQKHHLLLHMRDLVSRRKTNPHKVTL